MTEVFICNMPPKFPLDTLEVYEKRSKAEGSQKARTTKDCLPKDACLLNAPSMLPIHLFDRLKSETYPLHCLNLDTWRPVTVFYSQKHSHLVRLRQKSTGSA